ncbi:hypothetical protein ACOSQ3_019578 [Xanthoceras sorbifolium]
MTCMTKPIGRFLGNQIRTVREVDEGASGDCMGKYIRVRVLIAIDKPLQRFLKVNMGSSGTDVIMLLRYERLLEYCFECGYIGHPMRECDKATGCRESGNEDFAYGSWMRAASPVRAKAEVVVFQAVKNKDNVEQLHGTKADFGETLHGASGDFGEMLHGASGDAGETMHGARGASLLGNNVEVHGGNVDLNNNGDSVVIGELQRVQPCMDNILHSVIPSAASRVEVFAFSTGCSNAPRGRRWKRRAKERNDDDTVMSREDLGGKRLFLDADP